MFFTTKIEPQIDDLERGEQGAAPDRYFAGLPVPACLRAGADRRSIAAGELRRYI